MGWWISLLGIPLIAAALLDIFHTLWHPSDRGSLSAAVMSRTWKMSGLRGRRGRAAVLAGPLAMIAVVATWGAFIVLGWALIYWPHLPASFSFSPGLRPASRSDLLDALYVSLVTVATLGFGDIVPTTGWLRLIAPLQALVGFGLLTAAGTWVLQIFPALGRRRTLSLRVTVLRRAKAEDTVSELDSATAAQLLQDLAAATLRVRVDLTQYPETYYFRESDPDVSLAVMLSYAGTLASVAYSSRRPDVRFAADNLTAALDDLANVLDEQFLRVQGDRAAVARAYLADHGYCAP